MSSRKLKKKNATPFVSAKVAERLGEAVLAAIDLRWSWVGGGTEEREKLKKQLVDLMNDASVSGPLSLANPFPVKAPCVFGGTALSHTERILELANGPCPPLDGESLHDFESYLENEEDAATDTLELIKEYERATGGCLVQNGELVRPDKRKRGRPTIAGGELAHRAECSAAKRAYCEGFYARKKKPEKKYFANWLMDSELSVANEDPDEVWRLAVLYDKSVRKIQN